MRILVPLLLVSSVIGLFSSGCSVQKGEGFAIYLTAQENPGEWPPSAAPEITGEPVIAITDIESYDRNHHELTLTQSAIEKLAKLDVPMDGREFAVCVNGEVIYTGAFWTPFSSLTYNGPVIVIPFDSQNTRSVKIELGYPSGSFFTGSDPRSDPKIFAGLAGRIVG